MILSERFIQLVSDPSAAIWISNCNNKLEPDLVRLLGAKVEADNEHLLLFVPVKYGKHVIENFSVTNKLTFLLAIILTNESYQLKGEYLSHRPCTEEEVTYQEAYFAGLCDALDNQALSGDKAFDAYYSQPSIAVRMVVRVVYEQTPKVGTGEKVL